MIGRKLCLRLALTALMSVVAGLGAAEQNGFPFDSELLLDVKPMPGSKAVPNMDVAANGAITLEMWCNRVEGQVIVAANIITVITGSASARQCPSERVRADSELLATLAEVTTWRRQGNIVMFVGPRTLRFRMPTN
jgi:heat shock protein HslJ